MLTPSTEPESTEAVGAEQVLPLPSHQQPLGTAMLKQDVCRVPMPLVYTACLLQSLGLPLPAASLEEGSYPESSFVPAGVLQSHQLEISSQYSQSLG